MSVYASGWAWAQNVGSPVGKLVLIALADYADDDGLCWPGFAHVAEKAECSELTVKRQVKALEDAGLLVRTRRRRTNGTLGSYDITLSVPPKTTRYQTRPVDASSHDQVSERSSGPGIREIPQEPSVDLEPSVTSLRDVRDTSSGGHVARPRDEHFEALAEACGIDWRLPLTSKGRASLNGALAELRTVGATPQQIRDRARELANRWGPDKLTPHSLAKHWATLAPASANGGRGHDSSGLFGFAPDYIEPR